MLLYSLNPVPLFFLHALLRLFAVILCRAMNTTTQTMNGMNITAEIRQYDVPEDRLHYNEQDGDIDVLGLVADHFNMYDAVCSVSM
jgi:hypothetical protein